MKNDTSEYEVCKRSLVGNTMETGFICRIDLQSEAHCERKKKRKEFVNRRKYRDKWADSRRGDSNHF